MITTRKQLTLTKLRDRAQREFNAFIRARDAEKGCVSCKTGKVEQASHFYNAGQYTALRFNEDNVAGSCLQCNYFKSGNLLHYRPELLRRIGQQRMDLLESTATRNRVHKWQRFELEEIYKIYKKKNAENLCQ